jgi:bHLH factor
VPNGAGTENAAKAAILSRAVQYIHHLKENEARNIEKWTLEKLLMDQAMGDLQVQLDEIRRMWEEERKQRQRAEHDLEVARGEKRASDEGADGQGGDGKRQRTD